MKAFLPTRLATFSTLLTVPALVLITTGVLSEVGIETPNETLGAFGRTLFGKIFFSPVIVLVGVLASLALNLWAACRVRVGLDSGTVYVTFWLARTPAHWIFIAVTVLLTTLLLGYAFVENFSIVPR